MKEVKRYEAKNGTIFEDKKACEEYEKVLKLEQAINTNVTKEMGRESTTEGGKYINAGLLAHRQHLMFVLDLIEGKRKL